MSGLVPDPANADVVWSVGRDLKKSSDGGKSFTVVRAAPGGDDYHDLWIDPRDPRRMATGADQGAVVTLNGGASWSSWYNQPTGQFYRLAADDRFPYWIYSGQQDTGTVGIASRSDYGQLTFRDWHPVGGDERDGDVPDPEDPDLVYGAGLGGRADAVEPAHRSGADDLALAGRRLRGPPGHHEVPLRLDHPDRDLGPRKPHALYVGAQVLFRSLDRGETWATVSPDLTGAVAGAADCDGAVPVERATACGFGAIFAIAPSPAAEGLVWVGTTNGRVQKTRRRRRQLDRRHAARSRGLDQDQQHRRLPDRSGDRLRRRRPPPPRRLPPPGLADARRRRDLDPDRRRAAGGRLGRRGAAWTRSARGCSTPEPGAASSSPPTTARAGAACSSTCR